MIANTKIKFSRKHLKKIIFKFIHLFIIIFLLSSCSQRNDSPFDFSKNIFQAIKNQDFEKFAEASLFSNEDLTIEYANKLEEPIPKNIENELRQKVHADFNDIQKKLFEANITLDKMNLVGVNSYEKESDGIYKIHLGKLTFESNNGTNTMEMKMLQKNNGKIYLIGTIQFTKG